jgi:tripartite-type tricarboxylate transporter receptor subunit TctC
MNLFAPAVLALSAALVPSLGHTQPFPSKPLRIIVPAVAGSAVDVQARRVAPMFGELLGQSVVVENRPGGNSAIGAREVARAAPDGYTLLHGNVNNSLNDLLSSDKCCRLNEALVPVSKMFSTPLVMVVNSTVAAGNLKEYLALARAKPDFLTYASGGPGAITQLLGEKIKTDAGIRVREVPYKSIGAEMPDLLAGHVMTAYLAPVVVAQHIRSGKLRALGVASATRVAAIGDVPTLAEAGLPGVEAAGWNGLFAPAGTPEAVVRRLHQEMAKVLASAAIRAEAVSLGYGIASDGPEEFGAFVRSEIVKWGKVIKDSSIKME